MARFFRWVPRCVGCGRFMRWEDIAHGTYREPWHDACVTRADEAKLNEHSEDQDDVGLEQTGEGQEHEW